MKVFFEASFGRDLKNIKDKALLRRIEQTITELKAATTLNEIKNLIKMRGFPTFFRIRVGDYRIGLEMLEDEIIFVRVLHRKDIYRYFP
jgi:mRNA interferase RelE/StbE